MNRRAKSEVPLPSSLVDREVQFRLNRIGQQASQHGLTADQYVQAIGENPEQVVQDITADAQQTVKAQLVVDAIGRKADIQVTEVDLQTEVARQGFARGLRVSQAAIGQVHRPECP